MTKHFSNNSVMRRASQFENHINQHESIPESNVSDTRPKSIHLSSSPNQRQEIPSIEESMDQHFIITAFTRFQQEFSSLFPDGELPFNECDSYEQARELLKVQQKRIVDLNKELNKAKFTSNFLHEILSHNEKKDFDVSNTASTSKPSIGSTKTTKSAAKHATAIDEEENLSDSFTSATSTKEQYVTVITLNDSTYGEIRSKVPSQSSLSNVIPNINSVDGHQQSNNDQKEDKNQNSDSKLPLAKDSKVEPIYWNTLETNKGSPPDKVAKKRPPTPPRKPKFTKQMQSISSETTSDTSQSTFQTSISKSESLKSISRIQGKFNGPLQQISTNENVDNKNNSSTKEDITKLKTKKDDQNLVQNDEDNISLNYKDDYDNIYDTVTPDSVCDSEQEVPIEGDEDDDGEKTNSTKDDETSSHEMLSRSSSTDELSNYVNIDYFLRKNSLGRSNSNILGQTFQNAGFATNSGNIVKNESEDDNEANLSSMRSSDYEHMSSSNENLIDNTPNSVSSLKSFASTTSSSVTSSSSLRTRNIKLNDINKNDLSSSYPPNLSTFTPPIRNQPSFFPNNPNSDSFNQQRQQNKDNSTQASIEKGDNNIYSNGDELNQTSSSNNSFLCDKSNNSSSSVEYYAYTDILDSLPNNESQNANSTKKDEEQYSSNTSLVKAEESPKKAEDSIDQSISENNRHMQWNIIRSIIESENVYLDCLSTLIQYMKALSTTTTGRENALLSNDDLNTIFYRIPELHQLHNSFLNGLKHVEHGYKMKNSSMTSESKVTTKLMTKYSIGELFYRLATHLNIYSDFLRNYSKALETANRCGANNAKFSDIIKSIKVASLNGQFTNLIDLLHKPVARLQKNALVLHDLLKYVDSWNEDEQHLLKDTLKMTQTFLSELNMDTSRAKLFPIQDKFQRRLVKESFIIESGGENRRKLRHLFLFNDVIVCAKYKASTKQRFTFELKWFQMLNDILLDPALDYYCSNIPLASSSSSSSSSHRSSSIINVPQSSTKQPPIQMGGTLTQQQRDNIAKEIFASIQQVESLQSRAYIVRYDMFIEEKKSNKGSSRKVSDKYRKKLFELESELVLWLPSLKFAFSAKNSSNKWHTFYLSSEYERSCWFEAIKRMQYSSSTTNEQASLIELQRWIESCRKCINPNLGSFLLRTNKDESLRFGDLVIRLIHLNGHNNNVQNIFFVIETDSYGHYFKNAVTRLVSNHESANINQEFLIELEGTQSLRLLCYENVTKRTNDQGSGLDDFSTCSSTKDQFEVNERTSIFRGKVSLDLTSSGLSSQFKSKELAILDFTLLIEMNYLSWKSIMERIPPNKICGSFGITVAQVCKREKSKVPYLIMCCINEVQRRGLREVGIYRVSGLSSDVQRLKKAFETNPRDALWLIGHIDIHAVTGLLKLYLRELPESLFTNDMYKKYFMARDLKNFEDKERQMTTLLSQLPEPNQSTVIILIDHLSLVNRYEEENKMSLNNLATIFGPTMLRTNSSSNSNASSSGSSFKNSNANSNMNSGNSQNISNSSSSQQMNHYSQFVINTDLFTASTIDVMAQADILYFFLRRKSDGLSLTSVDREETSL